MKTNILAIMIASSLALSSCGLFKKGTQDMGNQQKTETSATITGKKWKLIELNGKPVGDKINGKEPFLELDPSENRYSASGGCNGLGGTFTLSDNMRIKFSRGMSTMMACEDMSIEQGLSKVFTTVDNYTVSGNILSLNKARMAPLAKFQEIKQDGSKEQALNGTWELNYISGPRIAFEGLYPNKKPTITFDVSNKKINGNSSCNNYNGSLKLNGHSINFGPIASTKMACEGSGESVFFKTLETVTTYDIQDNNTLHLIMGDIAVMRFTKK